MELDFWTQRWEQGLTAWNQASVHPTLIERWDDAGVAPGSDVFVPLCGSSIDMAWLADRGHRVIGCELSEIGVRQFFDTVDLAPSTTTVGESVLFEAGPYRLWCGDLFALPGDAIAQVGGVYDRASLIALPDELRRRYAEFMAARVPVDATTLLLTFVYDEREMDGPPFSVDIDEVRRLYSPAFDVELLSDDEVLERNDDLAARGLSGLSEQALLLRRPA